MKYFFFLFYHSSLIERRDCDIKPFDHIIRKKPRTHKHRGNLGKKRVAETDLGLIESPSGASSSLLRSRSTSSHSSSSLDYASKSASGADLLSSLSSKRSLKRSHFPSCLPSHSKLTENKSTLPLSSGSANYSSAINEYTSRTNPNLTLAEQARPEPTHQAKLDSFSKHRLKHPQTASMSCVSSCSSGTSDSLTPPMLVNSPPKDSGSHSRHSSSLHIAESTKGDVEKPKSGLVTKTDDLPCQNNRHHMENSVDKTTTVRQNKSKGAYSNSKLELLFERLLRLEHSHLALKMSHILIHFNRNHESSISIKEPIGCHDPARSFGGTQILHNNGPKVIAFDLRQLPDACLTQLSELIAEDEALSLKLEESNTTAAASQVLLKPTSPFSAKNGSKHHPSSQELEVEAEINKPIHSGKLITSKEPLEEGEASSSSSSSSHNYASSTSASSSSRPFSLSPPSSVTSPSSISSSSPKHSPVYNSPSNKTNLPNVFCDLVPSKTADQLSQKPAEEPGRYHESNRATFHRSRHLPVDMPLTPNKPLEAKPARQSKGSLPVGSTGAAAAPRLTRLHQSGPCEADPLVSASVSGRDKPPSKSLEQSVQQRNVVPSSSDSADQTDEATDTDA
ncbi:unnamed protein product [Protopolystoma xenopodis]|uniref:Uncharacterized protein n=1 Tax=Protopolystoma xenopodis TaxID=117903 RepID=A0A3S5CT33_9PLAT|nr:unnamed protein product [Protopolystoma xenopodis]